MELQIDEEIQDPSAYIQLGSFFKIIKAVVTIAVFTLNGQKNDYFMAYFFFWTCLLGAIYFWLCGFEIPITNKEDRIKKTKVYFSNLVIKEYLIKKQKNANCVIIFLTFFAFIVGAFAFSKSHILFSDSEGNVSTMGATSMIMILINLQAWPSIREQLNKKKRLKSIQNIRERAIAFVEQLDVIIEFCTAIMHKMKELSQKNQSQQDESLLTKDEINQKLE